MNPSDDSLIEKVTESVQKLTLVAADLNKASNELGQSISAIDAVLQKLNIGITTWTVIKSDSEDERTYWRREIGYARIGKKWGIAIRRVFGELASPEQETSESWFFNDAPRWIRVESIAKIPALLEDLIKNTEDTTKRIKTKIAETKQLAAAIMVAAAGKNQTQGSK